MFRFKYGIFIMIISLLLSLGNSSSWGERSVASAIGSSSFDLMFTPGALMVSPLKFFVVGHDQRLLERYWDGTTWQWTDHGKPFGVDIASAPGALIDAATAPKFFVVGSDGRLFERRWDGAANTWLWGDHGKPFGVDIAGITPSSLIPDPLKFFVVGRNGRLYERYWDGTTWQWTDHGKPFGVDIASAPGALIDAATAPKFFVVGSDGRLFERRWDGTANTWQWTDHGKPFGVDIASAPGALIDAATAPKFFVVGSDGRLFERRWDGAANTWLWGDHGKPFDVHLAAIPPSVVINDPLKFFVVGSDGQLFERRWDTAATTWVWSDHGKPFGIDITSAPGALMDSPSAPKFFITGSDGRLFERRWDTAATTWVWSDHGDPHLYGMAVPVLPPTVPAPGAVPFFSQQATAWRSHPLRTTNICSSSCSTIGACGCTLTSVAMIFKYYGATLTPATLSDCMGTSACPFNWTNPGIACSQGMVTSFKRHPFSWNTLNTLINMERVPVIVGMSRFGNTHFVVVYEGSGNTAANYRMHDPGHERGQGLPLSTVTNQGWKLNTINVYRGTNHDRTKTPSISEKFVSTAPLNDPVGITFYHTTDITRTVKIVPPAAATEMVVWTEEISHTVWQPVSSFVAVPMSDRIFVQFRDENGSMLPDIYATTSLIGQPDPMYLVYLPPVMK